MVFYDVIFMGHAGLFIIAINCRSRFVDSISTTKLIYLHLISFSLSSSTVDMDMDKHSILIIAQRLLQSISFRCKLYKLISHFPGDTFKNFSCCSADNCHRVHRVVKLNQQCTRKFTFSCEKKRKLIGKLPRTVQVDRRS